MSLKSLLSTPGAEQLRAWRKLSASEKPWRQIRVREAVSGGISTEEIRMKFSVDTDTRVFEMLTFEGTLGEFMISPLPRENQSPEGRCVLLRRMGTL